MYDYNRENSIIKLIGLGPLLFIPLFVTAVIVLIIYEHEENFDKTLIKIEQNLINQEKKAIKSKVDGIADLITYQNEIIVKKLTNRVKDRVITAHKISSKLYNNYKNKLSEKKIKELIITTLRPLIWNGGESFIFILDHDGVFQLAPKYLQHKEGSSIINFQDATGRFVIKEEIALVKSKQEGFLWDTFTKPSDPTKKHYEQVVFVKDLGFYNWYMGSGEYLDTASKISNKELLKSIDKISTKSSHYVFVNDIKGNILLNETTPMYVNKNISEIKDKSLKEVFNKIHKKIEKNNKIYFNYIWKNPNNNEYERKYSYIRTIENTNWVIGSGFYESEIKSLAAKQTVKLYEDYHLRINYILTVGFISILISLVFSYLVSKYLKMSFTKYQNSITKKTVELQALNETLELKVAQRTKELQKSKATLEVLATTDTLTKVHNRYSIMSLLENEISRVKRYDMPLCVMLFDIDYFKQVNDNFGHDVGDQVLVKIAKTVKNTLREIDLLGRYGGEEFLVIFPNTSFEDAKVVSERIRYAVESYHFDKVGTITISLGLVKYKSDENSDQLFKRLDQLLYHSKDNGRNCLSH